MSDELRKLAEAATPGPWAVSGYRGEPVDGVDRGREISHQDGRLSLLCSGWLLPSDAEFIAAVSPDVIIGLLDERDALRQIVTTIAHNAPKYSSGYCVWCSSADTDVAHYESCVWRRAVEATKATMEEGTQ